MSITATSGRPLLVIHTGTFFVELIRLARFIVSKQGQAPVFMFYPQPTALRDAAIAAADGIQSVDHLGRPLISPMRRSGPNWLAKARNVLGDFVAKLISRGNSLLRKLPLFELGYQCASLAWRRRFLRHFLLRYKPSIVVLGGDMVGYDTAAFVQAGHDNGIPVVIVPSTMSNGLEQAEVYFGDPRHGMGSWLNRHVARCHPKWMVEHKGRQLLRENGGRALAMEWLGLAPPRPWIFNSGSADAIAIESAAMKEYYVVAGLAPERLIVTGAPSDDVMASISAGRDAGRRSLYAGLQLPDDKPLLLTALPPDFLYVTGGRPQCDFSSYEDLVRFWAGTISRAPGFNKVICLHPSVNPDSMRFLESSDTRIASVPTVELIPLCDLYVASVSSTIRWAMACGKPVINYDVYRYRYTDYMGIDGVLTIEEQQEFSGLLHKLTTDEAYRNSIARLQLAVSKQWGTLDGKAGERILLLFRQLIAQYAAAH